MFCCLFVCLFFLQRNYQFDFLRKQHPLFVYFTKLVEQYSRILLPPYNMTSNLRKEMEDPVIVSVVGVAIDL